MTWTDLKDDFFNFFSAENFSENWIAYLLWFLLFAVVFYYVFKVMVKNRAGRYIVLVVLTVLVFGVAFSLSGEESEIVQYFLLLVIAMIALLVFTVFNTDIKRSMLDSNIRRGRLSVGTSDVDKITDEITRAVQDMSKKNVGAIIVLDENNLPEHVLSSGTIINADISSQMIEAVFYPKAPLHDGALIIRGDRLLAAGCFLPNTQNDALPKEMGSRHRATLGISEATSATAIVVSEETGIVSIAKSGVFVKRYADTADIKQYLNEYYRSDDKKEKKKKKNK